MQASFRRAMDALYLACVSISGVCLVAISVIIPWGVWRRYGLNSAASWPEPMAILLTIVMTFLGGAACYRHGLHMRVTALRTRLPALVERALTMLSELLVGALGLFMVVYGIGLVQATWYQEVPEFPVIAVGVSYLPIPVGGALLLLFVAEQLLVGPPPGDLHRHH
jgi:TRAP-type C4-dicarboxylate transport system permease small subunit